MSFKDKIKSIIPKRKKIKESEKMYSFRFMESGYFNISPVSLDEQNNFTFGKRKGRTTYNTGIKSIFKAQVDKNCKIEGLDGKNCVFHIRDIPQSLQLYKENVTSKDGKSIPIDTKSYRNAMDNKLINELLNSKDESFMDLITKIASVISALGVILLIVLKLGIIKT